MNCKGFIMCSKKKNVGEKCNIFLKYFPVMKKRDPLRNSGCPLRQPWEALQYFKGYMH